MPIFAPLITSLSHCFTSWGVGWVFFWTLNWTFFRSSFGQSHYFVDNLSPKGTQTATYSTKNRRSRWSGKSIVRSDRGTVGTLHTCVLRASLLRGAGSGHSRVINVSSAASYLTNEAAFDFDGPGGIMAPDKYSPWGVCFLSAHSDI